MIDRLGDPSGGIDNDFHHWKERLALQLDPADAALATALLTHACRSREGATVTALFAELQTRRPALNEDEQTDLFARLRDLLERDGYWRRDESAGPPRYCFRLEPLRRWWHRRHSL